MRRGGFGSYRLQPFCGGHTLVRLKGRERGDVRPVWRACAHLIRAEASYRGSDERLNDQLDVSAVGLAYHCWNSHRNRPIDMHRLHLITGHIEGDVRGSISIKWINGGCNKNV